LSNTQNYLNYLID